MKNNTVQSCDFKITSHPHQQKSDAEPEVGSKHTDLDTGQFKQMLIKLSN